VALALTPVILSGQRGGPAIEPRILAFEARPATIRPGESAQLVWQTEATRGLTIEPEVGTVAVRGSKQVFPTQTTTYTLRASATLSKTVTITVAGTPVARPAPAPARADASGRIDGHTDFSGVYGSAGLPQGEQAPALKPDAEKFRIVRTANDVRGRTTLVQECVPLGIPQTYITPYPWQFIQTPRMMIQVFEYPSAVRFIPLDGRPLPADPDPAWMGTAVGRWEGDTLVIESAGYNDKTEVHGFLHTDALHVIEKFRKLENGNLQYEVTVQDPNVWVSPWVIPARTFQLRKETEFVSEFVCDAPPVDYQKLFGKD
jgi:antitoxin (DNA-binding transcriptional repressor) of toxin-antitoxin stability system